MMERILSYLKHLNQRQVSFLGGGIILLLIILFYGRVTDNRTAPIPEDIVSVTEITAQDMDNSVNLIATVEPYESVSIKSRLDSQITKVAVTEGQDVKEGDTLFLLDDRFLKAQLEQLQATLKSNEAEVQRTKNLLERDTNLSGKGVRSKQDYDNSLSAFTVASANLEATKAQIDQVKTQLDYTIIKAPISGKIGSIKLTLGNNVKANDTIALTVINKIKPIKARISVPQRYYEAVNQAMAKQQIVVRAFDSSGKMIEEGKVIFKENAIDDSTRTLSLVAEFKNDQEKLWPGMFIDAVVLNRDEGVLTVPLKAIQPGQEQDYIYLVENNKAVRRTITLIRSQGETAIIKGDVAAGDQVISDGLLHVRDGKPVTINGGPKSEAEAKQ